jgi:type VI secretion system protein ImpE
MARETGGVLDGQPFNWIADADARLGPVLEVILYGSYFWVPFQQIRSIDITQVSDLRDLVWLPARFTWVSGGEAYGLIPTRYPGSEHVAVGALQLARRTQWMMPAENTFCGLGQRMFVTDRDEYSLLDIRTIFLR